MRSTDSERHTWGGWTASVAPNTWTTVEAAIVSGIAFAFVSSPARVRQLRIKATPACDRERRQARRPAINLCFQISFFNLDPT